MDNNIKEEKVKKIYKRRELTLEERQKKKEYFRQYYLRKKREKGLLTIHGRGRRESPQQSKPEKIVPKDETYTLYFD